jgi:hypothetical protein
VSEEEEEAAEEGVILPKDEETGDEEELDEAMQLCMKNMKQCERMVVAGLESQERFRNRSSKSCLFGQLLVDDVIPTNPPRRVSTTTDDYNISDSHIPLASVATSEPRST